MKKLIALLMFLASFCATAVSQSWVQISTFPDTYYPDNRNSGVYVTVASKAYVGLGMISTNNGYAFLKDFWRYDILANTWTKLANFPGQARYNAVAFAIDDKIYVGGGNIVLNSIEDEYGSYKKDFYVFNTVTNTWSSIPDMPTVRGEAVAFAINGKGYVACGAGVDYVDGGTGRDLYCYDPATSTWSKKADFPGASRKFPVGFALGNKGYVGGGFKGFWISAVGLKPTFYNDFYEYDPSSDQWTAKANINNSMDASGIMYWGASVSADCKGYIVSPQTTDNPYAPSSKAVVEYNPTTNTWSAVQAYPESLIRPAAWYVNGTLYAGLGSSSKIYSLALKTVAGANHVCTTQTYTIHNPSNYPVQWTKSGNLSITSSSNSSITVSRYLSYKGAGWIQATIQDGCPTTLTKYVQVGPQTANFSISSYPYCANTGEVVTFVAEVSGVNYSWTVNGGTLLGGQGTQSVSVLKSSQTLAVHCYVTGKSAANCYGPDGISTTYIHQCYGFTAVSTSPNPASTSFDVELSDEIEETQAVEIELRNHLGVLVKSEIAHGNKFNISALELRKGLYVLRVKYGDRVLNHRVIIEK